MKGVLMKKIVECLEVFPKEFTIYMLKTIINLDANFLNLMMSF